jgi:hypothetical protein
MDDFVSRNLVAFVRANPDPNGYVVERGYALDGLINTIAPIYEAGGSFGPLNKACGTCAIINLAPEDMCRGFRMLIATLVMSLRSSNGMWKRLVALLMRLGLFDGQQFRYLRLRAEGHYMMTEAADAEGRPLMPIPFPAVVYTAFHGGNLSMLAGADRNKMRQYLAQAIKEEGVPSSVFAKEFSLPPAYPLLLSRQPDDQSARAAFSGGAAKCDEPVLNKLRAARPPGGSPSW